MAQKWKRHCYFHFSAYFFTKKLKKLAQKWKRHGGIRKLGGKKRQLKKLQKRPRIRPQERLEKQRQGAGPRLPLSKKRGPPRGR